jgi:hypothetical protein
MAELAALEGSAGLASSIITSAGFSIDFGRFVRDVAKAQGELPKALEDCREYIEVVVHGLMILIGGCHLTVRLRKKTSTLRRRFDDALKLQAIWLSY